MTRRIRATAEIEYIVREGYAEALMGDAWSIESEQRLHDLIDDAESPTCGRERRT